MGTTAMQDDPMLRLRYYRETGQPEEAKRYEQYLRETGQFKRDPALLINKVARQEQNDQEALASEPKSYAQQALGGIASQARDIPGAEVLQSYLRAITRGRSMMTPVGGSVALIPMPGEYSKARSEIRDAEDANPASGANRVIGGTVAALATPGSAMLSGARYGAAKGLLQSDAEVDAPERIRDATVDLAVGGAAGKAGDLFGKLLGKWFTPSLGKQAARHKAGIRAIDDPAFEAAAREGTAAGGTSPEIQKVLAEPDIAPFAEIVRKSRTHAGADDATVLREVRKLMSEQAGKLENRMFSANDFKAGTSLEASDTGLAKDALLDAADTIMPSLRPAVEKSAVLRGARDAMRDGADIAESLLSNRRITGKKLETKSVEAFLESVKKMSPQDAAAAKEGVLGRLKEFSSATANPLKLFGAPSAVMKIQKLTDLLNALDRQAGATMPRLAPASTSATSLLYQ